MADCIKCGAFTKYEKGYCYSCYVSLKYSKNNINIKEYLPSEGEEYLIDFFKSFNIKAEREKVISSLENDATSFRKADFYLPKYSIYIEFLGQWNVDQERTRYIKKMETYSLNNIPCVFLYPENLGIIEHVFDKRIQKVLIQHKMNDKLSKYRIHKLIAGENERLFYIGLFILILFLIDYKKEPETNVNWILAVTALISYQIIKIVSAYYRIFKLNSYPLRKFIE
jgi:hypothetical protein